MNKKRNFAKMALLSALLCGLASPTFIGCKDNDEEIKDIQEQINAVTSALHKVGQVVIEGHIQHCVRDGIQHGDADKTIESFTKAVERFANMQ